VNERLEKLARQFFDLAVSLCPTCPPTDFVVVTHLLEDRPWFLRAVARLGRVVAVIPKRKSMVPRVRDVLQHEFPLLEIARSDLETNDGVRKHLLPLQQEHPLCLLDIGGYFVDVACAAEMGLRLAGIVEDTENGHVKYQNAVKSHNCRVPVYSVARSELKRPENYLVGQSLVFSVEAILRQRDELLHGRRACVIGYGNIGRSIAQHLHHRRNDVVVFDHDPMKLIEAFTHGFRTPETIAEALRGADIVFCVTGNHSVGLAELRAIQEHAYVATVTSPDDELRKDELKDIEFSHRNDNVTELRSPDGKIIYLMNRGQAVNFIHGSVVGPFIQLLQAEILVSAATMLTAPPRVGTIGSVGREAQQAIATKWLEVYRH
jgi:adenosylhomocysteinase